MRLWVVFGWAGSASCWPTGINSNLHAVILNWHSKGLQAPIGVVPFVELALATAFKLLSTSFHCPQRTKSAHLATNSGVNLSSPHKHHCTRGVLTMLVCSFIPAKWKEVEPDDLWGYCGGSVTVTVRVTVGDVCKWLRGAFSSALWRGEGGEEQRGLGVMEMPMQQIHIL
jgi:hypothetical protein